MNTGHEPLRLLTNVVLAGRTFCRRVADTEGICPNILAECPIQETASNVTKLTQIRHSAHGGAHAIIPASLCSRLEALTARKHGLGGETQTTVSKTLHPPDTGMKVSANYSGRPTRRFSR